MTSIPLISIIIPVYNVEQYLPQCLDSILSQSYKDFEVILINDGSTDNCGEICDQYAKRDKRIKVIQQKNSGVSSARNKGLQEGKGHFFTFIDADDYINPHYITNLISNKDEDLVIGGLFFLNTGFKNRIKSEIYKNEQIADFIRKHISGLYFTSPCAKLYKRSIIKRCLIRFDEKMRIAEDLDFNLQYLKHCKWIRINPTNDYIYRDPIITSDKKYNLRYDELVYTLDRCNIRYNEIDHIFNVSSNRISLKAIVAHYPIINIISLGSDDEYYELCHKYLNLNTRKDFYSDIVCSPINRLINTIIKDYTVKQYQESRMLMYKLSELYGGTIHSLQHPRLFYKLLYYSIRKRFFYISTCLLKLYSVFR